MFDVIGGIAGSAIYATIVGVLIGFSRANVRVKVSALALAGFWAVLIVMITTAGGFQPGVLGLIPGPVVAFTLLLFVLFGSWHFFKGFREALLNVPLPALIAVNAARFLGVFFLLLQARGRLSTPFAQSAGWGDVLVASLAIPLAVLANKGDRYAGAIRTWNFLGALDLVVAVTLGALSAPGTPFRVFNEGPGTLALTTLPWIMIPTMLVPIFLLNHLLIYTKMRALKDAVVKNKFVPVELR
jgi:succinate dehydrogenase hydrophobic anchor subunit